MGPIKDKSGANTHWLIIFRDITERKRLEKEILEISDLERRRIGQDLHDDLCQHLAGIELMSQVLEQKLAKRSRADAARAADVARHVRDAIGQTRSLARGLSPATLESEGLASALVELGATTEKLFGITCRVECPGRAVTQPLSVATHLYRIAQEAVTNAIKHGKGTDVLIQLQNTDTGVMLKIVDNGRGFGQLPPPQTGMGLRIMHYRAGMIGGSLTMDNGSHGGATVICSVPAKAP
jgi:signal transduction histidine kinase